MKDKVTEFERQQGEFARGEQELRKAGYLFGDESRRITSRIARMTPREVDEALQKLNRDLRASGSTVKLTNSEGIARPMVVPTAKGAA